MKRATKKGIELEGALWFHKAEQKFLGSDRIALLEKVGELGSITKAAKAVGISYKNAWDIINMINNLADRPLVERLVGGKGGGRHQPDRLRPGGDPPVFRGPGGAPEVSPEP